MQNLHIAGLDKPVGFYSLDDIISVGGRVKSPYVMRMIGSVPPAAGQA